ncbi:MAG: hypothetical protein Q8Q60_04565 [Candidatus Chromulinivorax sp.]|nr:hypothetical protein [Candidatus Chromulinivorax sp.]
MQKSYTTVYFVCCVMILFGSYVRASEYGPNTLFQMPYETDEYIGNFTGTLCVGSTDQAYNEAGNTVSFLQHYGNEDLLLNFIDPLASHDIAEKIGTISFQGQVDFALLNLSYYKNIMHHMFIGMGAIVQNLNVYILDSNIDLIIPLTTEQEQLLTVFENKIPSVLNTSGILSAYLECGYNRKFTDLKTTDALQLFLRGAILTPQWVQGGDLNLLQFPFTGNLTFGYQVIGTLTMQMTKHMTFGIFATVNSFQSKVIETPYNEHIVNNQLLIDKKAMSHYTPGTVYNGAVYWKFDNFVHDFTFTTGLSFMYGAARKVKPVSPAGYYVVEGSDVNISLNSSLQTWAVNALLFELDYNFLTKENPQGPCVSLFFNMPLSGYNYPKVNAIGGEFGLTFNYYL